MRRGRSGIQTKFPRDSPEAVMYKRVFGVDRAKIQEIMRVSEVTERPRRTDNGAYLLGSWYSSLICIWQMGQSGVQPQRFVLICGVAEDLRPVVDREEVIGVFAEKSNVLGEVTRLGIVWGL